jgi:hypothetical protein
MGIIIGLLVIWLALVVIGFAVKALLWQDSGQRPAAARG